jgi:hypothetical protein
MRKPLLLFGAYVLMATSHEVSAAPKLNPSAPPINSFNDCKDKQYPEFESYKSCWHGYEKALHYGFAKPVDGNPQQLHILWQLDTARGRDYDAIYYSLTQRAYDCMANKDISRQVSIFIDRPGMARKTLPVDFQKWDYAEGDEKEQLMEQFCPATSAPGASSQLTISMPPAPPPVPLAQPLRPDPAALPSRTRARFDASLDELVRDGVVSPVERARIRSGSGTTPFNVPAHQQPCDVGALSQQECNSGLVVRWRGLPNTVSGPTVKPLSPNEHALLQRIRSNSYTPQWRTYGQCKYDWAGWRMNSNGTRTTAAECGGSATRLTVGVSCDRLLVAGYTTASGWSKWREPAGPGNKSRQGEDEMVAALCANV